MKLSIKLILFLLLINQTTLIYARQLVYAGCHDNELHMFDVTQPDRPWEPWNPITIGKPWSIVFTPDAKYAYVADLYANEVFMIDTQAGIQVGDAIPTGTNPYGMAITPDGQFLYVASDNSSDITIISTATNKVVDTIALGGGETSFHIVFTPNGKYAYVNSRTTATIHVIDTAKRTELTTIEVGGGTGSPQGMAITPDGKFLYVAMASLDRVEIIDTGANTLLPILIRVGDRPREITITPDGKFAYVVIVDEPEIAVIDLQTKSLLSTITNANMSSPHSIAAAPDSEYVYFTDYYEKNMFSISTLSQAILIDNYPVCSGYSVSIAVSPGTMEVSAKTYAVNSFLSTDYYNTITWTAPVNPFTLHYNIYRDREQKVHIATIDGTGELKYEDHKRTPGSTYHYYITAENPYGIISIADTSITVNR